MPGAHEYGIEITEDDPMVQQPEKITVDLKPHQLASVYKASAMERDGVVNYHVPNPEEHLRTSYRRRPAFKGRFRVHTNVGIIGDIVGYGKTLTALGIVAATPIADIYNDNRMVHSHNGTAKNRAFIRVDCEKQADLDERQLFNTTLVIVPRGPVYTQWEQMLREKTTLKHLAVTDLRVIKKKFPPIGSTNEDLKRFFDGYDVVLLKSTNIKTLLDYYDVPFRTNPIRGFARVMVDEAPDIISTIPILDYRFLWLISATYSSFYTDYFTYSNMSVVVKELITEERAHIIMVRCNTEFTKRSFDIPAFREIVHECLAPRHLTIVQPFLTRSAIDLINANDIAGAIREIGGKTETEDSLVKIITRNLQRDIFNKEHERAFVEGLDLGEEAKAARITHINNDIERLRRRMADLEERVRSMTADSCPICYEDIREPIMLSCTHAFCGRCIMKWIETKEEERPHRTGVQSRVCPTCRTTISRKELVAVVKKKEEEAPDTEDGPSSQRPLSKVDTIMNIIRRKPDGKFLVFSQHDATFEDLYTSLGEADIEYSEIKGSTPQMMKVLDRFRSGDVRVILLNTMYAGSGIDISCATDVVLFHSMGLSSEQAIGRAQRVGRTSQLTVHRLCYPHEIQSTATGRV